MSRNTEKFVPVTPAGTVLTWLASPTEAKAWAALMKDAAHMPYRGIEGFKRRGYTVENMTPAKGQP